MLGEKLGEFQDKVTGRQILSAAASMLCLALVLFPIANVRAAELQILAGGAMTGPLGELATQFESASGLRLVFRFGTTPELIKLATTGGPFDLGIVPVDVMKDAAAQVRFASGPTTNIARARHRSPRGCSQARHRHTRCVEADAAQRAIHRAHTSKRDWHPGFAGVRNPWHQRGDES